MKKIIIFIILLSFFLFGCSQQKNIKNNCESMGYVPVADVNTLVNLTNKLIDIANYCFADQNITPLNHLNYYTDLKKNIIKR
jgi:PBP1b-binding outer membrane lipoprotein LpoB